MARPIDHFSDRAALYARHRPDYPPAVAAAIATAAPGRRLAWEPACGSGQLTRSLTEVFDRVVATDPSAEQLARAPDPSGVVRMRERAEESALGAGVADAVVVGQAAHWLELDRFYSEVRRVARPGGVVALVSYGRPEAPGEVGTVVRAFHDGALAAYWPPARRHVDEGYAALPFPFERVPTSPPPIERRWTAADFLGYAASWSGVRRLLRSGRGAAFESFEHALREAWGPGERTVRWPMTVLMGRVGRHG